MSDPTPGSSRRSVEPRTMPSATKEAPTAKEGSTVMGTPSRVFSAAATRAVSKATSPRAASRVTPATRLAKPPTTHLPVARKVSPVLEVLDDETEIDGMSLVEFELHGTASADEETPSQAAAASALYLTRGNPLFELVEKVATLHRGSRRIYEEMQGITRELGELRRAKQTILGKRPELIVEKPQAQTQPQDELVVYPEYLLEQKSSLRFRASITNRQVEGLLERLETPESVEALLFQVGVMMTGTQGVSVLAQLDALMGLLVSDLLSFSVCTLTCKLRPASHHGSACERVSCSKVHTQIAELLRREKELRAQKAARTLEVRPITERLDPLHLQLDQQSEALGRFMYILPVERVRCKVSKQMVPSKGVHSIDEVVATLQAAARTCFTRCYAVTEATAEILTAPKVCAPAFRTSLETALFHMLSSTTKPSASRWVVTCLN